MIDYKTKIAESGATIYDEMLLETDALYIPSENLTQILSESLISLDLNGLALRTRSKVAKTEICNALGYSVPKSFKKTQPRFFSQNFDVYIQQSRNVQIWNEEVDPKRRYVFICVSAENIITAIRIINGDQLAKLDKTGTLTSKFQATMRNIGKSSLLSTKDTNRVQCWSNHTVDLGNIKPNATPTHGNLLPISEIFSRISSLEGETMPHLDYLQERNRGAGLHSVICEKLGYHSGEDDGTYPDIMNQLIEIKLQTSPTIDLGLHSPNDKSTLLTINGQEFRSSDVRYIIVDGIVESDLVRIRHIYVVNGRDFEKYFPLFGGKIQNKKLQMTLPKDFFN